MAEPVRPSVLSSSLSNWGIQSPLHGNITQYLPQSAETPFTMTNNMIPIGQSYGTVHGNSDKPFACHICGKGFLSNNGFTLHMRSHEGRKFMCSICDSKFFQKVHLKTHLNKVHKMVQCVYCLELFGLGSSYNQHVLHCRATPVTK